MPLKVLVTYSILFTVAVIAAEQCISICQAERYSGEGTVYELEARKDSAGIEGLDVSECFSRLLGSRQREVALMKLKAIGVNDDDRIDKILIFASNHKAVSMTIFLVRAVEFTLEIDSGNLVHVNFDSDSAHVITSEFSLVTWETLSLASRVFKEGGLGDIDIFRIEMDKPCNEKTLWPLFLVGNQLLDCMLPVNFQVQACMSPTENFNLEKATIKKIDSGIAKNILAIDEILSVDVAYQDAESILLNNGFVFLSHKEPYLMVHDSNNFFDRDLNDWYRNAIAANYIEDEIGDFFKGTWLHKIHLMWVFSFVLDIESSKRDWMLNVGVDAMTGEVVMGWYRPNEVREFYAPHRADSFIYRD